ncbi:T9SS type A sorting domain-containing protein [Chryseobacterium candidae]|uniref:T9SS type A sorting domain-containing protein n=1 Tax=Chryseobacterium candidae TaxID=1978493 RepID=A0ABY2R6G7_9FLAO|nr:T9SS type A sorting domain-containing protein [Chryseobacterium candidae]THV58940.1 T9SS type A sorting domain-containing protein [Chryseobacterium candidae]
MKNKLLFCWLFLMAIIIKAQNNDCSGAVLLTVGTSFSSGAVNSSNTGATTDGPVASCNSDAVENVWFKVVVPASGKLMIETDQVADSLFDDSVLTVYSGTCGNLTEIDCNDDKLQDLFSSLSLTGQTPGATLYISVSKYDDYTENGEFQISAYDLIPAANDNCAEAISLSVGTDFSSGAITATNLTATTDGPTASCNSDAVENVWFKVVVPASGKLMIETDQVADSLFDDSVLTVYSGTCGNLTEIDCNDDKLQDLFSSLSLTGQTPGATLYISVSKYDDNTENGEFQISVYDTTSLATNEVIQKKREINVSPNPFTDQLTISDISDVQSISIFDPSGKLIKTIEKPSSVIYLTDLKDGLYLLSLKMNSGIIKTIKIIKK